MYLDSTNGHSKKSSLLDWDRQANALNDIGVPPGPVAQALGLACIFTEEQYRTSLVYNLLLTRTASTWNIFTVLLYP